MDDDGIATPQPAWFGVLLDAVDRAFGVTGSATPGWPDPHPDRSPLEEEYSRVTDVDKYRILDSRLDAWALALTGAALASVHDVPAETWTAEARPPDQHLRVRRFAPERAEGLIFLAATTLVEGRAFGLDVGIGRSGDRPVLISMLPDCGCDACDTGSADLLDELDGWVLTVARGGVVHARAGEAFATRSRDGWCTAGRALDSWLDPSAPVPERVERWIGASWVDDPA
jgi:hypothetical protein